MVYKLYLNKAVKKIAQSFLRKGFLRKSPFLRAFNIGLEAFQVLFILPGKR